MRIHRNFGLITTNGDDRRFSHVLVWIGELFKIDREIQGCKKYVEVLLVAKSLKCE